MHAVTVLHRHELRSGFLGIDLGATEAWQNVRYFAMYQVAAVQFGGDLYGQSQPAPGSFHCFAFWDGTNEVAAEGNETVDLASQNGFAGFDGVQSLLAGGIEAELLGDPIERHQFRLFADADRPLTLHIGMAPHRADPGTTFADIATQQQ